MLELLCMIVLTLVYYFLFIKDDRSIYKSLGKSPPPPPFKFDITNFKNLRVAYNNRWILDLPKEYHWNGKSFEYKDACHTISNGEFIPINDRDLFDRQSHVAIIRKSQQLNATPPLDYSLIYFFECQDGKIEKLHHCPNNTIFVGGDHVCIPIDVCEHKVDGYVFPTTHNPTMYYECQKGKKVLKSCNKGEKFTYNRCMRPADPCWDQPDGEIIDWEDTSYTMCEGGESYEYKCRPGEYFHSGSKECVSAVCRGKTNERIPHVVTENHLVFAKSYTQCEDGLITDVVHCSRRVRDDEDMELPFTKVLDARQECSQPKLCVNVRPESDDIVVPGMRYRKMFGGRYKHSKLFDYMTGYVCDNQKVKKYSIETNSRIDETTWKIKHPLCKNNTDKVPYPPIRFDKYIDCNGLKHRECSPYATAGFDYENQVCFEMPNGFVVDENLLVFRLNHLRFNWFEPYKKLGEPRRVCTNDFIPIRHYNVCAHPRCEKYPFLKQLKHSEIMIDDEYKCVHRDGDIVPVTYFKFPWQKLNFWKQKLEKSSATDNDCQMNQRLEMNDFVMRSVLHVTCDEREPFVLCPSSQTQGVNDDCVCIPDDQVGQINMTANKVYTFKEGSKISHLTVSDNRATCKYTTSSGMTVDVDYNAYSKPNNIPQDVTYTLSCNREAIAHLSFLPTNKLDKILKLNVVTSSYEVEDVVVNNQDDFRMVEYDMEQKIGGFD